MRRTLVVLGACAALIAPAAASDPRELASGSPEVAPYPPEVSPRRPVVGEVARVHDKAPRGPSVAERLAEIRRRVQAALRYPPVSRWREIAGETRVRFEIGNDGRARAARIAHSSGHDRLDAAALRAVVDAGVLPRVYGPLEVPVRFEVEPAP